MIAKKSLALMMVLAASVLPLRGAYADDLSTLSGLAGGTAGKEALTDVSTPEAPAPAPYEVNKRAPGTDVTAQFKAILNAAASGRGQEDEAEYKKLSGYRILFVPGFMTNPSIDPALLYKPGADRLKPGKGLLPTYFEEQIVWLRSLGLDAGIVDIESEAGIKHNASLIEAAISLSPKPVLIISHSKGGLDTLEALIQRPDLRGKVRGMVSIQSPYYGTPIADWVLSARYSMAPAAAAALKAMGGSIVMVGQNWTSF